MESEKLTIQTKYGLFVPKKSSLLPHAHLLKSCLLMNPLVQKINRMKQELKVLWYSMKKKIGSVQFASKDTVQI